MRRQHGACQASARGARAATAPPGKARIPRPRSGRQANGPGCGAHPTPEHPSEWQGGPRRQRRRRDQRPEAVRARPGPAQAGCSRHRPRDGTHRHCGAAAAALSAVARCQAANAAGDDATQACNRYRCRRRRQVAAPPQAKLLPLAGRCRRPGWWQSAHRSLARCCRALPAGSCRGRRRNPRLPSHPPLPPLADRCRRCMPLPQ